MKESRQLYRIFFTYIASLENLPSRFHTRSDTNWVVQAQKIARGFEMFGFRKYRGITIYAAKTKALISCVVKISCAFILQVICSFVFAYAKAGFLMIQLIFIVYLNKKTKEEVTSRSKKEEEVLVYPKENDLLVQCINPRTLKSNQMTYFMRPAAEQFTRGQAETPVPSSVLTINTASEGKTSLRKNSTVQTKQKVLETTLQMKTCTKQTYGGVLSLVKENVCTIIPKKGVLSLPTNTIVLNPGILPQMQGSVANVPNVVIRTLGTSESMGNINAAKAATSLTEIKVGSKRSAADVRNTIKLADRMDSEKEQSERAILGHVPVKCTPVIPISGPIPVVPNLKNYDSSQGGALGLAVPKLEPEDTFEAQKEVESCTESPGAEGDSLNLDYVVVKEEVEGDDEAEEAGIAEEVDPDWVPGDWEPAEEESQDSDWEPPVAKKQRKGSDSSSVSSQVYECGVQTPCKWFLSYFDNTVKFLNFGTQKTLL